MSFGTTETGDGVGGEFDYVGLCMARSAEGDAVADVLRDKPGVEVIQQPSFWDIRCKHRLEIDFDEVAEELGSDVDAYVIQHEMSTNYGRMVVTDDKLYLFSDPGEANRFMEGQER
jgi:propane monooxygenase coupling protein